MLLYRTAAHLLVGWLVGWRQFQCYEYYFILLSLSISVFWSPFLIAVLLLFVEKHILALNKSENQEHILRSMSVHSHTYHMQLSICHRGCSVAIQMEAAVV